MSSAARRTTSDLGADGKKLIKRLATSYGECREQAKAYGACIKLSLAAVEKGACEKEFAALSACFGTAITKARSRGL